MRIRIFASDSNPAIDRFLLKKPVAYCETEVREGRAFLLNQQDITAGIQLRPSDERVQKAKTERRGSPESSGCLTANDSGLNAEYRRNMPARSLDKQIEMLSGQYEDALGKHESLGRKGMPRQCAVIAARVKTILSDPGLITV